MKENEILLIKDPDGNWRCQGYRHGKLIETRTNDPQTALLEFLTHE